MPDPPYADPSDLQFGTVAEERQDTLDALLDNGESPEKIADVEDELRRRGQTTEPRAGNKAPVSGDKDVP